MEGRVPIPVTLVREAGAGAYTEITSVEAPVSAPAGSLVAVRVTIRNKYSAEIGIMVGGALEYGVSPWPTISFPNNSANFPAGVSYYFDGSFEMPYYPPGKEIIIHAYSYYYTVEGWVFDDERTRVITIGGPAEAEFQSLVVTYVKA